MHKHKHACAHTRARQSVSVRQTHARTHARTQTQILACTYTCIYIHILTPDTQKCARNTRGRASCCISSWHVSQPTILLIKTVPVRAFRGHRPSNHVLTFHDTYRKALTVQAKCSKNARQDAVCGIDSSAGVSARLPSPWQQASHCR